MWTSAPLQICHDGFSRWIQPFPTHDWTRLRSEEKFIRVARIVERLDAETIAREKDRTIRVVVNGEGKHPLQTRQHCLPPIAICSKKGFGITGACKASAEPL